MNSKPSLVAATSLCLLSTLFAALNHCSALDPEWLQTLPSRAIIYDSNQSGSFGIFQGSLHEHGFSSRVLIDTPSHEMYPTASSDGRFIAYAVHASLSRNSPADIWLYHRKTKKREKIISNGTFPRFSKNNDAIYFERNRSSIHQYDISTQESHEIFPKKRRRFSNVENVKPQSSPDDRYIAFISSRPERWHIWFLDVREGTLKNIGKGCEPTWIDNSEAILFVKNHKRGTKLYRYDLLRDARELLFNEEGDHFYYFPAGDRDGRFILFSKSLSNEQSHLKAPYALVLVDNKTKKQITLTEDLWTNRWPRWLPE